MNTQWENLPAIFLVGSLVAAVSWVFVLTLLFNIDTKALFLIVKAG